MPEIPAVITDHVYRRNTGVGTGDPRHLNCWYPGCGRPRSEHARGIGEKRPAAFWERYRACGTCKADLGKPCRERTGFVADQDNDGVEIEASEPHSGRLLRTGYARTGDDRG